MKYKPLMAAACMALAVQTVTVSAAEADANQVISNVLEDSQAEQLNKDSLEDGKYELYAEMFKTDKESYSMSNNGINHTVGLEVKDGEYFLTIQFKGLAIYNKYGYLRKLSYYDEGYEFGQYGVPEGTVVSAEVISTQKNSDGSDVIDAYNDADNLYPELVKIKLVDKASAEYVPLEVFVPIMEAIAEGSGTQNVLMKLDWEQLKKTDSDIDVEKPEEKSPVVDVTDEKTGVKVKADEGVFPEGVKVNVEEVTHGSEFEKAQTALAGKGNSYKLYAITFTDADGNKVTADSMFSVSYPTTSENVSLYRISSETNATRMKGAFENGSYTVTFKGSDSVALCALISDEKSVAADNTDSQGNLSDNTANNVNNTNNASDNNTDVKNNTTVNVVNTTTSGAVNSSNTTAPKTADAAHAGLYVSGMLISAAALFKLRGKKRKGDTV